MKIHLKLFLIKNGKYQVFVVKLNVGIILEGSCEIILLNWFRATTEEVHLVLDNKILPFF